MNTRSTPFRVFSRLRATPALAASLLALAVLTGCGEDLTDPPRPKTGAQEHWNDGRPPTLLISGTPLPPLPEAAK